MDVCSRRRLVPTGRAARCTSAAIVTVGTLFLVNALPAAAQSAENVAVVINDRSADSRTIGEYYASKRGVPADNLFHIQAPVGDEIDRAAFTYSIDRPLRALLSSRRLHDRVLYLVLTKDIPLRIRGSSGPLGSEATVDSELTLLYRSMVGSHVPIPGTVSNPYYAGDGDLVDIKPFTHRDQDIFLVSRLDGPSVRDVLALIDRGLSPASDGVVRLLPASGEHERIAAAAARIAASAGEDRVSIEMDLSHDPNRRWLGYYGGLITEDTETPFAPGSIAAFRAYTPPVFHRQPSERNVPASGSGHKRVQRTLDDLLQHGLTGAIVDAMSPGTAVRPDILFSAYLAGASIVEASYLSMASLSGNSFVIGDPLCAPFRQRTIGRSEIEAGPDLVTELPAVFSERRVAEIFLTVPFVAKSAIALTLGADAHMHRGDRVGERRMLEEAITIAPDFALAQFNLATLDREEGQQDEAIARYQLALDADPPNAREILWPIAGFIGAARVRTAALNNLAFALAVYRNAPHDALPLARSAVIQAPQEPLVLDTLAWVEYLAGDTANALVHIRASLATGTSPESVLLHAAAILAANGQGDDAKMQLNEFLRRRPDLASSSEVKRAQAQVRASLDVN
jgi:uncharacterized protein (TIGR03790 family)